MFQSIEAVFRSIETRETCFLKKSDWTFQRHLFKKFFKLSSLSNLAKAPPTFFCRFPLRFLQGFCLPRSVSPFALPFAFYFMISCIFRAYSLGIFGTFHILELLMIQTFFGEIDHWVFVLGSYINDP